MSDTELVDLHAQSTKDTSSWFDNKGFSEVDSEILPPVKPKQRKSLENCSETQFNTISEYPPISEIKQPIRKQESWRKNNEIVISPRDLESSASKPSASDSGFILSPGKLSTSSSQRPENVVTSEADDNSIEVKPKPRKTSRTKGKIAETSFNVSSQKTDSSPSHTYKKPVPSRRKNKQVFSTYQGEDSSLYKTSRSDQVLVHSPSRSSVSSGRGRGDDKDSGPSSLPARADTPASTNSHHPSVSEVSLEGSRSLTSQSDTRSYKERIRERVRSARGKTASEMVQVQQRSRLKHVKLLSSRLDVVIQKEEKQIEEALEKHEELRSKWKIVSEREKTNEHTEAECYDFFTQVWNTEVEERKTIEQASSKETVEREPNNEEQNKVVTSEYLGLPDEWDVIDDVAPVCLDTREVQKREKELYFYPPSLAVPLEEKLPPDKEARYPEMEGLYVGSQLTVQRRNRNRLEQRIMASDGLKWFGDDGEMISLPDPCSTISFKPPIFEEVIPQLEMQFKQAFPLNLDKLHILQPTELNSSYLLGVELQSLIFSHHPLFSCEHVVTEHMKDMFNKYSQRMALKNEERLGGRLQALRRARETLFNALDESSSEEQHIRLKRYSSEIQEVRQMFHSECRRDKQLLFKVLKAWKNLKEIRELQQYVNTPYQLRIHVQQLDEAELEKKQIEWEKFVEAEWEDLKREKTEEYTYLQKEYKKSLYLWRKKHRQMQKIHKQRLREKEDSIDVDDDSTRDEESEDEDLTLEEEPKPPNPFDWKLLRKELEEYLKECLHAPGEPKLSLELVQCLTPTSKPDNLREQQRRAAVKKCSLFLRLFYNNQEVCQTKNVPLGAQFEINFKEKIAIQIAEWPESFKVELYEEGGAFAQHMVAEIFIPIPSHTTVWSSEQSESYEFSNSQVFTFSHAGVGSGTCTPVPSSGKTPCLYTTGVLTCCTGWETEKSSGKILSPPEKYCSVQKRANINICEGAVDIGKLRKWAEYSSLDPNDPSNASFLNLLQSSGMGLSAEPSYFRLDPLHSELDFCKSDDLLNNRRLRLLYLRDCGEPEFRGLTEVPIRVKEISEGVFKAYEKRLSSPQIELSSLSMDPLDVHRAWGKLFLQEIRQRILKQCRQAQQLRKVDDIITEEQVPDIGTLGLTFMQWLQPKRPLKPVRKEQKKVTVQGLGGQAVQLIINVVRAFDVPVRKDIDTSQQSSSTFQQGPSFSTVPVRPFVEASFQGVSKRTTTAVGSNPTWNQDLHLLMRPPSGDFTPGNLEEVQDALHLHLFDEIIIDLLEDDRIRDTNIHQRLERHWLGSLSIPFMTLYHNPKIEGTFKLYSPPVLLGYEREPHHRQFSGYINEGHSATPPQDSTFLTIFVSMQPALNTPELFKDQWECGEPTYLQEHLCNWEQEILTLFPHRKPKTLVVDTSGKSVCITRFIRNLAPPELLKDEATNSFMAARYVSMIPSVSGSILFPGLFDIWLLSDQVLRLLSGDSEDHAVLLCCYLLYLKHQCWVLLGTGIPHGSTAYVLELQSEGQYILWDPASGQQYEVHSTFSPLRKVYCLFNHENIWANIQNAELPQHTRFDISRRSDWWPAFGRGMGPPTISIQPSILEYKTTSPAAVQFLQEKIEKHLRESLVKWRRTSRTYWNRYCVAILRKLLPALEKETWKLDSSGQVDHIHELKHILGSHQMCGFPINVPYTNMAALTECVRSTGVHFTENSEVEFALAVYIHPYPNNVLSVWIYVASLVRRR